MAGIKQKVILPLLLLVGLVATLYWLIGLDNISTGQIVALFAIWGVVTISLNIGGKVRNFVFSLLTLGLLILALYGLVNVGSAKLEQALALFAILAIASVSLNLINGTLGILSLGHHGFMLIGGYTTALLTLPDAARERVVNSSRSTMTDFTIGLSLENGFEKLGIKVITAADVVFIIAILALLIGIGLFIASLQMLDKGHFGGLIPISLGTLGILLTLLIPKEGSFAWLATPLTGEILFVMAIFIGGLLSMLFGVIVGFPSLRLRGDYLAIVTLGFGEIIRHLASTRLLSPLTNGSLGFVGVPSEFGKSIWWTFAFLLVTVFVIAKLKYSSYGRAMEGIREDEIAAEAVGINLAYHKVLGFAIAAFFAGIAGGLWVSWLGSARLEHFLFTLTFFFLVAISLGGTGSITGVLIGTALATFVRQYGDPLEETYSIAQWLEFAGVLLMIAAAGFVLYKVARRLPKLSGWWMLSSIFSLLLISPLFAFYGALRDKLNILWPHISASINNLWQLRENPRAIIITVAAIPLLLLFIAMAFYKRSIRHLLAIIISLIFIATVLVVHAFAFDESSFYPYLPIWLALLPLLILVLLPTRGFSKAVPYLLTFASIAMLAISALAPTLLAGEFGKNIALGAIDFSWLENTFRGFGMRSIFLAVLLIVIMIFRPEGIMGRHEFNWAWVFGERKDQPTDEELAQDAWLVNPELNKPRP